MKNYEIMTKYSKMEILEKCLNMALCTLHWEEAEETLSHIQWLFEDMKPDTKLFFFGERSVTDVQLQEDPKLDI